MKKLMTVLLSVCLILSMCVSSFAVVPDLTYSSASNSAIREIMADLSATPTAEEIAAAAQSAIVVLEDNGADTKADLRESADILYNNNIITKAVYDKMYEIIASAELEESAKEQAVLDKIQAIINDDSLDTVAKATKIVDLIKDLPAEEAQNLLDKAKEAGIIDDNMYNTISDVFNGSISIGDINLGDSPISGIGDFISSILGMLGIGGSGGSGESGNGGSKPNSGSTSGNRTDFEGSNAKTGDYAVASVAGIALVAGVAFVLTRKKNDKED